MRAADLGEAERCAIVPAGERHRLGVGAPASVDLGIGRLERSEEDAVRRRMMWVIADGGARYSRPASCQDLPSVAIDGAMTISTVVHLADRARAEGRHRLAQRADEVLGAVGRLRRAEQDLLERQALADPDPRAARQRRRGGRHAPVEAEAGSLERGRRTAIRA